MKSMTWWVEYDKMIDGKYMYIREFNTEAEANEFAKNIEDANVVGIEWITK